MGPKEKKENSRFLSHRAVDWRLTQRDPGFSDIQRQQGVNRLLDKHNLCDLLPKRFGPASLPDHSTATLKQPYPSKRHKHRKNGHTTSRICRNGWNNYNRDSSEIVSASSPRHLTLHTE
ncbi:uncharacterized protein [Symphalangus syndactylus]|uniref:uncharacterized protein isoform X5 n=1 Tax=Symphalangus syndactylus TaxID=9590 RepID=UPI003006AA54